jgi:O-antigen/teichoic acid export membrane protein
MQGFFGKLFRDIAVYGASDLLLKAIGFLTLPLYTRIFTPGEYGLWSVVAASVGVFSSVASLGGDSAYARYYFEAQSDDERATLTSTWLGFLAGWTVAATALVVPLAPWFAARALDAPQATTLVVLALVGVPLTLMNSTCSQVLRNQFRAGLFAALNVATTLLTVALGLAAVLLLEMGVAGLFAGAAAAAALVLPVRLYAVRHMLRPVFSLALLRRLLDYGVPLVPMSLAYWVFASSDRLLLARLSTMEQLGLFAVANSATSTLAFINSALGQAWSPHAYQAYQRDPEGARALYGQFMSYLLAALGLLCVGITSFAPELLRVLATPPFYGAAAAVGPLALGAVAYASTQVTAAGMSLTKRTRYFAVYAWAAAALNVGLNLWSIPRWGMLGAAWSTAAAYVFLTLAYLATSQRLWAVAYEVRRSVTVVLLTVAFTLGAGVLPALPLLPGIALKLGYCAGFCVMLVVLGAVDEREWAVVRQRLGRAPRAGLLP